MKWIEIEKDWKNVSKRFQTKWTKLTASDLKEIHGKREILLQKLRAHYPTEKASFEKEVDAFIASLAAKA